MSERKRIKKKDSSAEAVVVAAFSEDQAERLTGVSKQQLRYWDRTGFFAPSLASANRRDPNSRVYSFKDITALRILNVLRNQYSVPLQHLRKVAADLSHFSDRKWTAITLFVLNRKVIFVEPGSKLYREIVSRQYVMGIPLHIVVRDTKRDVEDLQRRDVRKIGQVERTRYINHNTLVVAGTRIPVAAIKRFAEDGFTVGQIKREYPTLAEEDIEAAIRHEGRAAA